MSNVYHINARTIGAPRFIFGGGGGVWKWGVVLTLRLFVILIWF